MKKKIFKVVNIVTVLAVFMASFYVGNLLAGVGHKQQGPVKLKPGEASTGMPVDRLNVLLLGIDARPGEKDARTDSMILVSIDKETGKIAMLSIPRDTLVDIPGHGKNKINSANQLGGADLAIETVENLLDVKIPYYVKTNFDGFKDIVDTLGGVTIDVEKKMYYPDGKMTINLKKGVQRLDGTHALQYVRFRHDALGDISRTSRQQKFLSALASEVLQAKTIVKLPTLIPQIFKVVDTNFGISDIFFLTRVASSMNSGNIVAQTLPGTFYNYKGVSYWKANDEMTKLVLSDMLKGVTSTAVVDKPIDVPKDTPKSKVPPKEKKQTNNNATNTNQDNTNQSKGTGPETGNQTGTGNTDQSGTGDQGDIITTPTDGTQAPGTEQGNPTGTIGGTTGDNSTTQDPNGGTTTVPRQGTPSTPPVPPAGGTDTQTPPASGGTTSPVQQNPSALN